MTVQHQRGAGHASEIALILRESLTRRGIDQWCRARNRLLGGPPPLELIAEGDIDEVVRAACAFIEGAYI
jgi:hypothetical protein